MEEIKELVDKVLKNRSLTIFLGIVVVALVMGWIGGLRNKGGWWSY